PGTLLPKNDGKSRIQCHGHKNNEHERRKTQNANRSRRRIKGSLQSHISVRGTDLRVYEKCISRLTITLGRLTRIPVCRGIIIANDALGKEIENNARRLLDV